MKISDLATNGKMTKGTKLKVRVPSRLQDTLGTRTTGEFAGLVPKAAGSRVQLVYVKVNGKRMTFRPQDLTVV